MTQEITAEQAQRIHDLDSYKAVTGFKRFKRTAEEMQLGLSPEDALKRRLVAFEKQPSTEWLEQIAQAEAEGGVSVGGLAVDLGLYKANKAVFVQPGDIVIRIRAEKSVDKDYFEHLPSHEVTVELDNQMYGWFDVKLGGTYNGNAAEFFKFLLENGLGEAIDHPNFQNVKSTSITAED